MPQPLVITLLLFALVLPVLGAVVLRLLMPRMAQAQFNTAAGALFLVVVASVLVLARVDIPSLQLGNLSILLPVTAPEDSILPLVPTLQADQPPPDFATDAPATANAQATATAAPASATPTATPEPTAVPTATPEPTAVPPTVVPPTAIPPTAAPAGPRKYTVQPGDTLLSIARMFDTTVPAIVKANKLTPEQADALRVGQELVIP